MSYNLIDNLPPGTTGDHIDRLYLSNQEESKIDEICEDCGKCDECPVDWYECAYCVEKYQDWIDTWDDGGCDGN